MATGHLRFFFASLALSALVSCTLIPGPAPVLVSLKLDRPNVGRGARDVTERQCIGIFVTGQGGETDSSEMGTRDPACFGIAGKFLGAFPIANLVEGTGVTLPISTGAHRFYLLAMEKGTTCANTPLSYFFPDADAGVAGAYAVARSAVVEVSTSSQTLSIAPSLYNATDLAPVCGRPQAGFCNGYEICDTFTDTAGTVLTTHSPEVGGIWLPGTLGNPVITGNNEADVTPSNCALGRLVQSISSRNAIVSFDWKGGLYSTGIVEHAYVARATDENNFLAGVVTRNIACTTSIIEVIAGSETTLVSSGFFECPFADFMSGRLVVNGNQVSFTAKGNEITSNNASSLLSGAGVGVGVRCDSLGGPSLMDNFRAKKL